MVDWPLVLAGVAGIVPAFLIMLWSYAPYDGHFKDNILFLHFMAGIFGGMVLVLFENLLRFFPQWGPYQLIALVVLGYPLLEQLLKLVVLNRRSVQGDRAAAFYGGAFGLGFGTMAVLFMSQRAIPLTGLTSLEAVFAAPANLLYLVTVGLAFLLLHFATGAIVGDGVRTRKLRPRLLQAIAALIPLQFLAFQFTAALSFGRAGEALIYLPLMLAYAGAVAWWADATLLPQALPPNAQRARRRTLLKERRTKAGP